jgi:hypothetical protein
MIGSAEIGSVEEERDGVARMIASVASGLATVFLLGGSVECELLLVLDRCLVALRRG